jgi:4-methylaminobutanoate oxidase (formaldehyde-forming)
VTFALHDPERLLLGDEPIWRDDVLVGRITSGAFGHTVGRSIGLGYVTHPEGVSAPFLRAGHWELEIAAERFPATAQLDALYDPTSARVRR